MFVQYFLPISIDKWREKVYNIYVKERRYKPMTKQEQRKTIIHQINHMVDFQKEYPDNYSAYEQAQGFICCAMFADIITTDEYSEYACILRQIHFGK